MSCPTVIRVTMAQGPPGIGLPAGTADAGKFVRKAGSTAYAYELVTPDAVGLPQALAATDSPTFAGLTLSGLAVNGLLFTGTGGLLTRLPLGPGLSIVGGELTAAGSATDLGYVASTRTVTSSTGGDAVLTLADGVNAGLMSSADYLKLLSLTFGVLPVPVRNNSGAEIAKGTPVYVTGSSGTRITIAPADASVEATAARTLGLTSAAIPNNSDGTVIAVGELTGLNTSTLTEGQIIWLSETTGAMTTTRPTQPAHGVVLGYCVKQGSGTSGIVYVKVDNGLELEELHDLLITGKATGQALMLAADGLWKNRLLVAADLSDSSTSGRAVLTGTPEQGRSALQLGSAAQAATTDFATTAQGALAATAIQPSDSRLTDAREWSAPTFTQAEIEDPASTVRRAPTGQRIRQAIVAWWSGYATTVGQALATAANPGAGRTAIGAAASGAATGSGLTIATARMLGRTTAGTGALEEISVVGATLSGGVLTITGGTASPGGTSGQVQFNNTGALGGAAGLTIDGSGNIDLGVVTGRLRLPPANASQQPSDVYVSSNVLYYRDGTNTEQRLLIASGNLASVANPAQAFDNLFHGTSKVPIIFNIGLGLANGSGASADPTTAFAAAGVPHHGVFSTGTTSTGSAYLSVQGNTTAINIAQGRNSYNLQQFSSFRVSFLFRIPILSDVTDTFRVFFGMYADGGTFANRRSAGMMIGGSTVVACATAGGTESVSAATDTYTANTWAKADIEWTGTAINVRLNNGATLTVNSGFPPQTSLMFIGGFIVKTVGGNARTLNIAQGYNFTGYSALP